ncbi:MAG: phytoene desaturase family protein [Bryobacteraceae bacterium]
MLSFSGGDAESYPRYEEHLERLARVIEELLLVTPPPLPPGTLSDWVDYLKVAVRLRKLAAPHAAALIKIFTQSAGKFVDEWFESDELKSALVTDGVIGANGGPYSPGTACVLMHHCMGGVGGVRGLWGFVRGGMGALAEAIAASARSHGAKIRTSAAVEKILVRNGQARGVVLQAGEEIEARTVVSNLDPPTTFLRLLDERDLPGEFVSAIWRYRSQGTSLKIILALDGLPEFKALPGAPGPQRRATMHICPSVEYVERAWDDAKYGRPSENRLLELTVPTLYDPSLAPPGKHILGIFLQYAPYALRGSDWDGLRDPYADHVLALVEEYAPGFRSRILHRQVVTPLDLERRFGITGGNIFHGEMSLDQMFWMRPVAGWADYRTPIRGLYFCGSGAHPGGRVTGAPEHNAAREILRGRGT